MVENVIQKYVEITQSHRGLVGHRIDFHGVVEPRRAASRSRMLATAVSDWCKGRHSWRGNTPRNVKIKRN